MNITLQTLSDLGDGGFMLLDPSKRLFWANILGTLLLVVIMPGARKARLSTLFSRAIWWHPSSRADMKIALSNAVLRAFVFTGSVISATAVGALISVLLKRTFGEIAPLVWAPTLIAALFTLTTFIVDDFSRFYLHYLQHTRPRLWLFHQTHHSALVLTPLTLLRTHPFEIICAQVRNALSYGLVIGVFFYAFGPNLSAWDVLGAQAFGFLFNLLGANLRHSQVWMHFGPLEKILISPAAHQVHHSDDPEHYDKNFGVCLALWDRIFGTHYDPRPLTEPLRYGIEGSPLSEEDAGLWTLYMVPIKQWLASLPFLPSPLRPASSQIVTSAKSDCA